MAYALPEKLVADAFSCGQLPHPNGPVTMKVVEIAELVVTSNSIVATDPIVISMIKPFTQRVPNGRHAVSLAIARFGTDERIAFARVQFSKRTPVTWKMAVIDDQDPASLEHGNFFGYGVDGATGCFMDYEAGALMGQRYREEGPYFAFGDLIIDAMEASYRETRQWGVVHPIEGRDENIVCFTTGYGDGAYPSFFGFAADGAVAQLVTDFRLFS
jgi:uncharacterized protein DUF4241